MVTRISKRLALFTASVLGGLTLSEAAVRMLGIAPGFGTIEFGDIATSTDPILRWSNAPGAEGINSLGLRGPELRSPKPSKRILVIGDSIAFGYGLNATETIPARVEAMLRARGIDAEVLNGGVVAYSSRQEGRWLEVHGDTLAPDEVIVLYCLNDNTDLGGALPEDLVRKANKEGKKDDWEVQRSLEVLSSGKKALLASSHLARTAYLRFQSPPPLHIAGNGSLSGKSWSTDFSVVEDGLGRVARYCAAKNIRGTVAIFPWLESFDRYPHRSQHDRVGEIARGLGLEVLDLLETFAAHAAEAGVEVALPGDKVHPNPLGAEIAAQALARTLGD